jgi:hypothetical protein
MLDLLYSTMTVRFYFSSGHCAGITVSKADVGDGRRSKSIHQGNTPCTLCLGQRVFTRRRFLPSISTPSRSTPPSNARRSRGSRRTGCGASVPIPASGSPQGSFAGLRTRATPLRMVSSNSKKGSLPWRRPDASARCFAVSLVVQERREQSPLSFRSVPPFPRRSSGAGGAACELEFGGDPRTCSRSLGSARTNAGQWIS